MLFALAAFLLAGGADVYGSKPESQEISILRDWRGDYPVSELHRFPAGQRTSPNGYLGNQDDFARVWHAFKPGEQLPHLDFGIHLVLFARNVAFYNRISIAKVSFKDGIAEILTIETRSAFPIEDKVGMAIAVIPRAGVRYIKTGDKRIPVSAGEQSWALDPLNATFTIEGREITLQNGRCETARAPDSATKIRTFVSGDAIEGDLDGDGDKDAVLFLAHDPGGSGTFYYVAVAENLNDRYQGTDAMFLGDRIVPKDLQIQKGLIIVRYTKRRAYEAMSTAPSVEALLHLAFDQGKLKALKAPIKGEEILSGQVTIGHEVRSFRPCSQNADYWLSGESPVLGEIMERYKQELTHAGSYTPLFMVLAGRFVEKPRDGFGADYAGAFLATQLVAVRPGRACRMKLRQSQ